MKYTKIIKNFITESEIKLLNKWTLDHYKEPYFSDPHMNNDDHQTRFTSRHAHKKNYKIKYPKVAHDIQKRLIKHFNIKQEQIIPPPEFTDGIVTGIAFSPGSCVEHCDPIHREDTYTLHCNFITQNPEHGGITYVEGVPYQTKEGDLIMYLASHAKHRVTEITGKTPRILWICGFCVFDFQIPHIFKPSNFLY